MNGATVYDGDWDLTPADRLLIEAKRWGSRLRFAVMLLFFRARGRFPRATGEVSEERGDGAGAHARRTGAGWRGVAAPQRLRSHAGAAAGRDPRPARLPGGRRSPTPKSSAPGCATMPSP